MTLDPPLRENGSWSPENVKQRENVIDVRESKPRERHRRWRIKTRSGNAIRYIKEKETHFPFGKRASSFRRYVATNVHRKMHRNFRALRRVMLYTIYMRLEDESNQYQATLSKVGYRNDCLRKIIGLLSTLTYFKQSTYIRFNRSRSCERVRAHVWLKKISL